VLNAKHHIHLYSNAQILIFSEVWMQGTKSQTVSEPVHMTERQLRVEVDETFSYASAEALFEAYVRKRFRLKIG
jgi:hypothetical protein